MDQTASKTLQQFLTDATVGPFVTLYLPIEANQTADKSKLMLKHLIAHTKEVMAKAWPNASWQAYGESLQPFVDDPVHVLAMKGQGMGIITNGAQIFVRDLEFPVSETAMVTATAQILPMILDDQRHLEFDLLLLQHDQIALYQNIGEELTPLAMPEDAPTTLKGTLGSEKRGGSLNSVPQGRSNATFHGHGEKSAEMEIDQRRYYQAVDAYVADHYSKPQKRRLVLFGLPQNIAVFREISRNNYLSGSMQIQQSPANLTQVQLDMALEVLRVGFAKRQQEKTLAKLDLARGKGRYLEDLGAIIDAAYARTIEVLVIRQGARIKGRLVDGHLDGTSAVAIHNNLLNDLADLTIAQGGQVAVLPEEALELPLVACLRYAPLD